MSWFRRLSNALRPGKVSRDIEREISFHLAERADDLRARGISDREAARQARSQFGNPTVLAERTRDMDVAGWLDGLLRHVRYAGRTLGRAPGFTAVVVLTLGLGIGANTAVFSALDTVLLRPLPYPDADRLMRLNQRHQENAETAIAPTRLADWDRLSTSFEAISGYYVEDVSETSGELPERVRRAFVAPKFLDVWGIAPLLGRDFAPEEHRFGGRPAVLISHQYWVRRLSGDPGVLGRTVRIGNSPYPIIGVMPETFRFSDRNVEMWFPTAVDAPFAQSRTSTWFRGIGRLRSGVTPEQARANLGAVQARLAEQYPDSDRLIAVDVVPLKAVTVGSVQGSLWLLFVAVSVLLLIACTNIAALLLARGSHRQHELAVRLSLGASRATLALQLLTETALLATGGAIVGLLVARAATTALGAVAADLPRIDEVAVDSRILLYTAGSTLAVTFLCGILPAVRAAKGIAATPAGGSRTQVSARGSLQWLLVAAQVALSVTLLAAGGLLLRSFIELSRVDPGFDPSRILAFRVSASWSETTDYGRLTRRIENTVDQLRALPGVEGAATTGWSLPGVPEQWESPFELIEATSDLERRMVAEGRAVSPEYFATLGVPLLSGENCRRGADVAAGSARPGEAMVNAAFALRYLSSRQSAVGLHLRSGNNARSDRIVGIVGNIRERGLDREPGPTVYWCRSAPNPTPYFLVRTAGDPSAIGSAVRLRMKEMDPLRSVYDVAPLEQRIGDAFKESRLRMLLVTLFAASALSLTCIGLYGTLSYVVSLRSREVGLRLAIGATRARILRQFLWQGLGVAGAGCAIGLLLALVSTRAMGGMLYGVSASDPLTLVVVIATVLLVAAVAAFVPAARAAFVEPMRVLREQ